MKIYQLTEATPGKTQMMSYIFDDEKGHIAVMDGGNYGDGEHLFAALRKITGQKNPHIDTWLMTHPHSDHVDAFRWMLAEHEGEWDCDRVIYHLPTVEYVDKHKYTDDEPVTVQQMEEITAKYPDLMELAVDGAVYPVGDMTFTVLRVPDYETPSNVVNNGSVVYRLTCDGVSALFLGDLGVEGGEQLLAAHGDIRSDMVQMAHHGQNGVDRPVYEAAAPSVCLWPTPKWLWDNNPGSGYNTGFWKTIIVHEWMQTLGVKMDVCTWQGDQCIVCRDGKIAVETVEL